tara:strand:- start:6 stop:410 length:405 start_codon:yes stop_codon:yes gene_type:complete
MYKARNRKTAEIIEVLRDISLHLSYNINDKDGKLLRGKLQNTSFKELLYKDPDILGWNYDKGREIGIKIYKSSGEMYSEKEIIHTLFHELAHSITKEKHHHPKWKMKDDYLQSFSPKYVKILSLKISHILNQNE